MYSLFRETIQLPRSSRNNRNPQGESGRRFRYINTRTVEKKAVRKKWIYESTCSNLKEHHWGYMTHIQTSFEIVSFSFLYSASQMFRKELHLPHEAIEAQTTQRCWNVTLRIFPFPATTKHFNVDSDVISAGWNIRHQKSGVLFCFWLKPFLKIMFSSTAGIKNPLWPPLRPAVKPLPPHCHFSHVLTVDIFLFPLNNHSATPV